MKLRCDLMEMLILARQRLDPLGSGEVGQDRQDRRTDGLTRSLERSVSVRNELQEIKLILARQRLDRYAPQRSWTTGSGIRRFREELFVDV